MRLTIIAATLAALAAPPLAAAAAPEAGRACIDRKPIRAIRSEGPRTLRFVMNSGPDYRSELANACAFTPGAQTFVIRASNSELCEADFLDVVSRQSGAAFASCGVGRFTPIAGERAGR